jgi:hypothetical protein
MGYIHNLASSLSRNFVHFILRSMNDYVKLSVRQARPGAGFGAACAVKNIGAVQAPTRVLRRQRASAQQISCIYERRNAAFSQTPAAGTPKPRPDVPDAAPSSRASAI